MCYIHNVLITTYSPADEQINSAVHAMMAMGFSNEGAWLTQLLESVEGNIPAALDIMHTSQSGRNWFLLSSIYKLLHFNI